ncbi:hypothetical protein [Streptomyces purpureus]|uniref:Uncharacterized protein n=1 Tax=Streptomyces purpureus TaxID=1951 RepID=A0A918HEX4_9ACTN|nr:hypothetical protein [Streptomyces purpureus]GGT56717.1 hypothetical protein GCM10014713_58040 [Streptomyces purpureus]
MPVDPYAVMNALLRAEAAREQVHAADRTAPARESGEPAPRPESEPHLGDHPSPR